MKGWECPRCGQCYSSIVSKCPSCLPRVQPQFGDPPKVQPPFGGPHVCTIEDKTSTFPICKICGKMMPPPYISTTTISWPATWRVAPAS